MEHNHCLGMYNRKNVSYDNISAVIYDEKLSMILRYEGLEYKHTLKQINISLPLNKVT